MKGHKDAWQEFLLKHKDELSNVKRLDLLEASVKYRSNGFSVIAVKKNKSPVISWKEDQQRLADDERLISGFSSPDAEGIAIVCGNVSRMLEVIDVDTKNDPQRNIPKRLKDAIVKNEPGLFDKLYIVLTPTTGVHIYYFCSVIERNQKLAEIDDKKDNVKQKQVIIETRGEGGYVIAPPSSGYTVFIAK
jgi:hypothetical protein